MERYSRNILIKQIGEEGQQKILNSKVLVAGAGGLGSTVIANLASAGIGNIGIIDNDVVELSNLNRQFVHKLKNIGISKVDSAKNWIFEYNPEINVQTYKIRLDENNSDEVISAYDFIIDCFDSYKSKFILNKTCVKNKKPLIHGGITEFSGQVITIIPGESACLNCIFPNYDFNEYVTKGAISPAVSTIASIQAMEALKIILGIDKLIINQVLSYDGLNQEFKKIPVAKNTNCPLCNAFKVC